MGGPHAFFEALRNELADSEGKQLLFYLHGYNTSFDEAARRAGQLFADLKVDGASAFFSWPSKASTRDYLADGDRIADSEADIARFLRGLATELGGATVHIIAHSLGNRGLARAIQRITAVAASSTSVRFGQIILAAPDISVELFQDLARRLPPHLAANHDVRLCARPRPRAFKMAAGCTTSRLHTACDSGAGYRHDRGHEHRSNTARPWILCRGRGRALRHRRSAEAQLRPSPPSAPAARAVPEPPGAVLGDRSLTVRNKHADPRPHLPAFRHAFRNPRRPDGVVGAAWHPAVRVRFPEAEQTRTIRAGRRFYARSSDGVARLELGSPPDREPPGCWGSRRGTSASSITGTFSMTSGQVSQ